MARKALTLALAAAVALAAAPVSAQEPKLLDIGDVPGMWFEMEYARYLLQVTSTHQDQQEVIDLHEQSQRRCNLIQKDLMEAQKVSLDQVEQGNAIMARQSRQIDRLEDKLNTWWRHPATLMTLGAMLVGVPILVSQ